MTEKTVVTQAAPSNRTIIPINFDKDSFENLIQDKGYSVIIEKALKCPCRVKEAGNQALSNCQNCGATGFIFINPIQTRAIIHSLNSETKFKEWSEENRGTASLTVRSVDTLAFMDKITIVDNVCSQNGGVYFTQTLQVKTYKGKLFAYTVYAVKEVQELFYFKGPENPLEKLVKGADFTIESNKVILDKRFQDYQNIQLTIRYKHDPVYYVIDIQREMMTSWVIDEKGNNNQTPFPVHAIIRKAHYVLDESNYNGDRLINNSNTSC